jgi:hypothetical protein
VWAGARPEVEASNVAKRDRTSHASRAPRIAGLSGFLTLIQSPEGPDLWGAACHRFLFEGWRR